VTAPEDGGSTAHALNNLLCKIIGSAELALDRAVDPQVERELRSIMTHAGCAAELIADLAGQADAAIAPRTSGRASR
jgi:predicted DNA-binding protein (UPF0278 family)